MRMEPSLKGWAHPERPDMTFASIHREVIGLERGDAAWVEWFAQHAICPLRVRYETFADDPAQTLVEICRALGVEPPKAESVAPNLAKLADSTNLEWARRYKAELTDTG